MEDKILTLVIAIFTVIMTIATWRVWILTDKLHKLQLMTTAFLWVFPRNRFESREIIEELEDYLSTKGLGTVITSNKSVKITARTMESHIIDEVKEKV